MNWLLRMAVWARRPPSWQRVKLGLIVIGLCLALVAVERFVGWPDWLTTQGGGRALRP
jgi:hypothetical protein